MTKIGVLTSGGDSPGMNAVMMAVARTASRYGMSLVGIKRGYNGLLRKSRDISDDLQELPLDTVLDIADQSGTYLRTARCVEFKEPKYQKLAVKTLDEMGIEGLVILGGDGTFAGAKALCELGVPCICIPATIDNDLAYTEMTLGFDTAVNVCVESVRRIRVTSRSHDRPAVVEVMGHHCGNIALIAAVSTGSEIVLVPEVRWSVQEVADRLNRQIAKGNYRATVVAAEGCWNSMEPFDLHSFLTAHGKACFKGEPMSAVRFASVLKRKCGMVEARANVVGYIQRGADPTARDSTFAFLAGNLAVELLHKGITKQAIGMREGKVVHMPIDEALSTKPEFDLNLFNILNHDEIGIDKSNRVC